jgi:ATP-dependent Clp protease ATP-binding subunit ClpC
VLVDVATLDNGEQYLRLRPAREVEETVETETVEVSG